MNCSDIDYKKYVQILCEELQPAMGCTEPIAIAASVDAGILGLTLYENGNHFYGG